MRQIFAFWRFVCDRCNRKESVSASVAGEHIKTVEYSDPPKGWAYFHKKIYCEGCAAKIKAVIGGLTVLHD